MPRPVDTTTKQPWPEVWANRMLQVFRRKAIADLQGRDRMNGITDGRVYDTVVEGKGEHQTEQRIVNPGLVKVRHNYREVRTLFKARWYKFCSQVQDLNAFKAEFEKPDLVALKRVQDEAKAIEDSLVAEAGPIEASLPKTAGKAGGAKSKKPVEV